VICSCGNKGVCQACQLYALTMELFGASDAVTVGRTAKPLAVIASDASGVKA